MDSDEVRKRKEYAERKVKERHAALRKEAEERRKQTLEHRERVQSVLKREQVLLQKRMQKLNEDEERKKVTLAKQHEATSRIAAINKSPKSFAFGSSTPRTLTYLDNLPKSEQQYDKKLRPLEGSSQVSNSASTGSTTKTVRLGTTTQLSSSSANRPTSAIGSMTSSMYVTSSAPPTRHSKTITKPTTTMTSKRLSHGPVSMMTQSVYTPTSRPATSSKLSVEAKATRGTTLTPGKPTIAGTPRTSNNKRLPIPKKLLIGKVDAKKASPLAEQSRNAPNESKKPIGFISAATKETVTVIEETSPLKDDKYQGACDTTVDPSTALDKLTDEEKVELAKNVVEDSIVANDIPTKIEEVNAANEFSTMEVQQKEEQQKVAEMVDNEHIDNTPEDVIVPEVEPSFEPSVEQKVDNIEQISEILKIEESEKREMNISEEAPKSDLIDEETSSLPDPGFSANTSLADELINIGIKQSAPNETQEIILPAQTEVLELNYPLPVEPRIVPPAPDAAAINDLVDVFGNDFINQNQPQRVVNFDEDTDSGKASPTSSETSSTTDEVTPRSVIDDDKNSAPRVIPLVRSAEDIARKEKEAREAEERKSRLAAILAKSRGMASPMTNTLPPTADDIKDSPSVTSPPMQSPPQSTETSSQTNTSSEESAEKATNESGRANDVLARVAALTNSSTLQKILQRKQGSNPSLQTSESTGGEIY